MTSRSLTLAKLWRWGRKTALSWAVLRYLFTNNITIITIISFHQQHHHHHHHIFSPTQSSSYHFTNNITIISFHHQNHHHHHHIFSPSQWSSSPSYLLTSQSSSSLHPIPIYPIPTSYYPESSQSPIPQGTIEFMAPEVMNCKSASTRTDMW